MALHTIHTLALLAVLLVAARGIPVATVPIEVSVLQTTERLGSVALVTSTEGLEATNLAIEPLSDVFRAALSGADVLKDVLRVSVPYNTSASNSLFATTSIPLCTLFDARFRTELALSVRSGHGIAHIELRPRLSPQYAGCSRPSAAAWRKAVTAAALQVPAVTLLTPDAAVIIPSKVEDAGVPFPGQKPLSKADILTASKHLDPEARAALEVQLQAERETSDEAPKSFFQQYWHILLPVGVLYIVMQMGGSGGGGAAEGGAARQAARS